ncbi:hypothetical protein EBESD8_49160 [Rhodococcus aetherivorans]|nr:hypothetical protein EBESD8_49160 [Rhodococcus aetherivorans]
MDAHLANLPFPQAPASAGDSAAPPGSCGKAPRALYVESGKEPMTFLPLPSRRRPQFRPSRADVRVNDDGSVSR